MGERDDRIEALKRAEGGARSGLGGVEQKYQNEQNAPADGRDHDAQIAALMGQRNSLQEQLAKVEGELSELQRGWDAERKAALGRDAQESKQQISPSDQQRADDAVKADPSKQAIGQQPGTTNQLPDSSPQATVPDRGSSGGGPQSAGQGSSSNSGSNEGSGSDRSDEKPAQERDKGFPPFEKSDRAPGGFDWKDISNEPVNFQKVDPNDGNFLWGQAKSPTSDFKPYSQVLYDGQVANLDATMKEIQRDDAAAQQLKASLNLDKSASDGFDRAQFESGAQKLNQTFAEQDKQREQFGSNTLIDPHQSQVDRQQQLDRWDDTRAYCRGHAERELDDMKTQLRSEVGAERQRLEANDQSMMTMYEKVVAGQADAQQRLANYDAMLKEGRDQQIEGFKALKNKEFTMAVEDRADALQQQHFPEVYENGPKQYFPPIPTLSIGDDGGNSPPPPGGPSTPPGGGGGGGAPAMTPQQPEPGAGGAASAMAPQQSGPGAGGAGGGVQQQQGPAGPAM
jgi:hypothetical protein